MIEFTCAWCKEEFVSEQTEEDFSSARLEGMKRFEQPDPNAMVALCEGCFRKLEAAYPPELFVEDQAAGIERKVRLP